MKNLIKIGVFIIITLNAMGIYAQNLEDHKWKNRLVLVLTEQINDENYLKQVKELKHNVDGMNERKILVYHITPESFKTGLSDEKWQKAETDYRLYKTTDSQPEIILIGLDGGIKLRADEFLSVQQLFATIDAMPMRRQEMNR